MPINWQDVLTSIGTTLVSGTVVVGAAAWVTKTLLSDRLARQAEAFKIQIKADADAANERLRNSLQMTALEHQVRFAKLHEKRGEVIAELYACALDAYQAGEKFILADGYTSDHAKQQEASLSTQKKLLDFYFFIEKSRIYLPEETCTLLDSFVDIMRKHVIRVGVYGSIGNPTPQTLEERHKAFEDAYTAFEKDIPAVRKALEDDFRQMLGVEKAPFASSSPK